MGSQHMPEEARDEIRQVFRQKQLPDDEVENVVEALSQSKKAWIDVMLTYELGLSEESSSPSRHGLAMAVAFVLAGAVPLVPYLFCGGKACFVSSTISAAVVLWITGALRTLFTGMSWLRGGLEMLGVGALAGAAAYGVGHFVAWVV